MLLDWGPCGQDCVVRIFKEKRLLEELRLPSILNPFWHIRSLRSVVTRFCIWFSFFSNIVSFLYIIDENSCIFLSLKKRTQGKMRLSWTSWRWKILEASRISFITSDSTDSIGAQGSSSLREGRSQQGQSTKLRSIHAKLKIPGPALPSYLIPSQSQQ